MAERYNQILASEESRSLKNCRKKLWKINWLKLWQLDIFHEKCHTLIINSLNGFFPGWNVRFFLLLMIFVISECIYPEFNQRLQCSSFAGKSSNVANCTPRALRYTCIVALIAYCRTTLEYLHLHRFLIGLHYPILRALETLSPYCFKKTFIVVYRSQITLQCTVQVEITAVSQFKV